MPRGESTGRYGWTRIVPRWAGDIFKEENLVRGPLQIDKTSFTADTYGRIFIPSGTMLGRTATEMAAGALYGPYAAGDTDVVLLAFDIRDANINTDMEAYKPGIQLVVKTNFLPFTPSAGQLTALQANYRCVTGL